MKHAIIVETPDNDYVPPSNPSTEEVLAELRKVVAVGAPWWLARATFEVYTDQGYTAEGAG